MKRFFRRLDAFLEALYGVRHRRELEMARRRQHDAFMLLVFSESLGIDNPVSWHLLELRPLLIDDYHHWHRRMGLAHSPLDCARCC